MTTPRGVKFQEHVFLIIDHWFLIVVGNHNMDRALLGFWDRLGFDAWLDFTIYKVLDKAANVVMGDLLSLVIRKFLILNRFLDSKGWPLVLLEVEIGGMGTKGRSINGGKVDNTLVLLSQGLEGFS